MMADDTKTSLTADQRNEAALRLLHDAAADIAIETGCDVNGLLAALSGALLGTIVEFNRPGSVEMAFEQTVADMRAALPEAIEQWNRLRRGAPLDKTVGNA